MHIKSELEVVVIKSEPLYYILKDDNYNIISFLGLETLFSWERGSQAREAFMT
jgi:hypothetical protein